MRKKKKKQKGNREYKDSVFRKLYHDKARAGELYTALTGKPVIAEDIVFDSLGGIFTGRMNHDVAFRVGQQAIIVLEQQSTPNENMPVRMLIYAAELYDRYIRRISDRAIYKEEIIPLPAPLFVVLRRGGKNDPEVQVMRLSDAFPQDEGKLELVVTVYNISYSASAKLLEDCPTLRGYSMLVDEVEKHRAELGLEQAILRAIAYCKENTVLADFLNEHEAEVCGAMLKEWNMEDALATREERGRDNASVDHIQSLMRKMHLTAAQAMEALSIPPGKQEQYLAALR